MTTAVRTVLPAGACLTVRLLGAVAVVVRPLPGAEEARRDGGFGRAGAVQGRGAAGRGPGQGAGGALLQGVLAERGAAAGRHDRTTVVSSRSAGCPSCAVTDTSLPSLRHS